MDPDMNKYDLEHACAPHPTMSKLEWEAIYREAWSLYYSQAHMKTLLRRGVATGLPMSSLVKLLASFAMSVQVEKLHPLQDGIVRLKHPSERRPELPRESPWIFWPRFAWETVTKQAAFAHLVVRLVLWSRAISRDPAAASYTDAALTPVGDDNDQNLDLFNQTTGAKAAVAHIKRIAELTGSA